MRVVSLFSGIGGFEVGIKNSSLKAEIVFSSEIDKFAQISYLANFPDNNLHGDITKIDAKDIPDHDLLVAGFPCQAFSIAGKKKGFMDTRGTLFFDIARILKEKKPEYFLLENVKNLISHNNGDTLRVILETLNELGYSVDYKVINSSQVGLPQSRERIFFVGKKGKDHNFNFFSSLNFNCTKKYIIDILENTEDIVYNIALYGLKDFLNTLDINQSYSYNLIQLFDIPKSILNDNLRQRRVYSIYGISPTILARSDSPKIYLEAPVRKIRRLTPRECFRCQGFKDDFIDNIINSVSMTQQYKQAGNAVSPPVITAIINHLQTFKY